jgi:hypothetical protein
MKTFAKSTMVMLILMGWTLGAGTAFSAREFETKITAKFGGANAKFGQSVSISGDRAIVGAYKDDDIGLDSGSVNIFEWNGSSWVETAKLTATDGADSDFFGQAVSISGDRAIVGAAGDDDKGEDSGSAYIFEWDGSSWFEEKKLTVSDGAARDFFGGSVSISGGRAIVGSSTDDDNGLDSGSAYIYERRIGIYGVSWFKTAKLMASDGAADDRFGWAVSISGDRVIVGANGANSAYIFEWNGTSWSERAKLMGVHGESVSISGDRIIVGARADGGNGAAYIFEWNGSSWGNRVKLTASDGAAQDSFGISVVISGGRAIVGSPGDDDNGDFTGSAYIFERCRSSWVETTKLTASDGASQDAFGWSVSISGDRAIVGAHLDDDNFNGSGSAYIYELAIPLIEYTFDGGSEGWTFVGEFPGFDEPQQSSQGGHLGLSPNGSVTSFGFWVSPPITVEAGKNYRARATVASSAADSDKTLTFRLRANQTGNQRGWVQVVVSTDGSAPSTAGAKTYELLINPLIDSGTDTIVLSFDMLSFDPFEDLNSWVYLENITLVEIP